MSDFILSSSHGLGATARRAFLLVTLLVFAGAGVYLMVVTRAATSPISLQPESGQLAGAVSLAADTTASGGNTIRFGGGATRTLLWKSDFSKGKAAYNPEVEGATSNVTFPIVDGRHVMRVKAVQGTETGYKFQTRLSHIGVTPRSEIYLKYQMFIPVSANMNYHGKLPGLGGIPESQDAWYTSSGGNMKPDSFSIRLHPRPSTTYSVGYPWFDAYIYAWHAGGVNYGTPDRYGIRIPLTTDLSNGHATDKEIRIPQGRWFSVEMRVKLNTAGVNDGILEMWIDGTKGISLKDVRWNNSGVTTKINQLVGSTFSNTPGYPNSFNFDYRDFELYAP